MGSWVIGNLSFPVPVSSNHDLARVEGNVGYARIVLEGDIGWGRGMGPVVSIHSVHSILDQGCTYRMR